MKYLAMVSLLLLSGCALNSPSAFLCIFSKCSESAEQIDETVDEQIEADLDVGGL